MRIARHHESLDAQRLIFPHPRDHGVGIADQRGAGAAAHQTDAGPQARRDLELVAVAAVQRGHAALPDRVHLGVIRLRPGDILVRQARNQPLGLGPGLCLGLAHDGVQADAKADRAAVLGSPCPHIGDLFGDRRRRLAPCQIGIDMLAGQFMRGRRGAPEIQRRMRLLRAGVEILCPLDPDMLAGEIHRLAGHQPLPDRQELVGILIAAIMAEKRAIRRQLARIAARHHIQQQAPVQHLIQRCGLPRRRRRPAQRGAQRHQQFQPPRGMGHRRCRDPGVKAAGAGRDQHPVIAQPVGGGGDVAQIVDVRRAAEIRGAQIAGVARGGQEPEDVRAGQACRGHSAASV